MNDLEALARVSAKLGSNRLLVQAAGGNTSVKADGVLWVKASGRWLAKALDEPVFVAVDMPRLMRALAANDPACETGEAVERFHNQIQVALAQLECGKQAIEGPFVFEKTRKKPPTERAHFP